MVAKCLLYPEMSYKLGCNLSSKRLKACVLHYRIISETKWVWVLVSIKGSPIMLFVAMVIQPLWL